MRTIHWWVRVGAAGPAASDPMCQIFPISEGAGDQWLPPSVQDPPSSPACSRCCQTAVLALKQVLQLLRRVLLLSPSQPPRCRRAKVLALKQVLQLSRYVLWLDSDAVLVRSDMQLLPYFLGLARGKDALFSSEFNIR